MVHPDSAHWDIINEAPYPCYGGGSSGGDSSQIDNEMAPDLKSYLTELELWARSNKKDSERDTIAFWILKIPAIISSVGTGILSYFELGTFSLILGVVAGACVLVDGIHPRGMLRNTHLRAVHDIRILTSGIVTSWKTRSNKSNAITTSKRIIKEAEDERLRIAKYIKESETSLKYDS